MEFQEYIKIKGRMCKFDESGVCSIKCDDCPLDIRNNGTRGGCVQLEKQHPERAEAIVKQWAEEHPAKTYANDFTSKFPNLDYTRLDDGFEYNYCVGILYGKEKGNCRLSCKECWQQEYKE